MTARQPVASGTTATMPKIRYRSSADVSDSEDMSRRRPLLWCLIIVTCGCLPTTPSIPPTTTTSPTSSTPVISSFTASTSAAPAPLTTAFKWSISDPNGAALTCGIDTTGDNVSDIMIPDCTSADSRTRTFNQVGSHTVSMTVSNGSSTAVAHLSLTVQTASTDTFGIVVRGGSAMTSDQSATFLAAANRWMSIVKTGLVAVSVSLPSNFCGTGAPSFDGTIDDLMIDASITSIDGPGGVLGQAGPCVVRDANGLPAYGVMQFDSADVASLESSGLFDETVTHEMGHILGLGTVWEPSVLVGAGTSNPRFTGAAAVGAWHELGGTGNVPVEATGGTGTADSHWRESVFDNEMMTGWINTTDPLSSVTVASLADIGLGVDMSAADSYSLPTAFRALGVRMTDTGRMIAIRPQTRR